MMSSEYLTKYFLNLPRYAKCVLVLLIDLSFCILTVWLAFYLRLGEFIFLNEAPLKAVLLSFIALPILFISGAYNEILRYSGWQTTFVILRSTTIYGFIFSSIITAIGVIDVPRTIGLIQPLIFFLSVSGMRIIAPYLLTDKTVNTNRTSKKNVLIYGAGKAGRQLLAALNSESGINVTGFIDDDKFLQGRSLNGKVVYSSKKLPFLINSKQVNDILLAIPSVERTQRKNILTKLREYSVNVRTLPSFNDLAEGRVSIKDVRELDIDDLLGRVSVTPNDSLLRKNIFGKTVLVTGAGGSIGSELCRQIYHIDPAKLLLVEQSEFSLYSIHEELKKINQNTSIVPLLASVTDSNRMDKIISSWKPDTIYHAAAYKHVPIVEYNSAAGISNNVFGTLTTASIAYKYSVSNFVLISSDKAVRPTNLMGASKRIAELALQAFAASGTKTNFSMVRFGNVLESSGSVVPKFKQQINEGGPITLTHPDITRYFMTIKEAAQLVIQAGAMADGGDVFVLDMGHPTKVMELAQSMIALSGLKLKDKHNPNGDIEIKITGLRPGEKLYEELLIGNNPNSTAHPRILKAHEDFINLDELNPKLDELKKLIHNNDIRLIQNITEDIVKGYIPNKDIVDLIYLKQTKENK